MIRSEIRWDSNLYKSNGEIRKQFSTWSIPKKLREKHKIFDGLYLVINSLISDLEFTNTYKITSGGEFRIKKHDSELIKLKTASCDETKIYFCIDIAVKKQSEFEEKVSKALNDNATQRKKRLKKAQKKPTSSVVSSVVFNRNPDVVAEVLIRASGQCELCCNNAPFLRKSNNTPYLEVHHKVKLSDSGEDTVENAIALCPNCHREQHFGVSR